MEMLEQTLFNCKIKVPKHIVKKNSRKMKRNFATGKNYIGKTDVVVAAENQLITKLRSERVKQRHLHPINKPVNLKIVFYFKDYFAKSGPNKGNLSKSIADLSNLYELPQDAITKAGIWEDDRLVYSHDGSRRMPSTTGYNYLEITITEFKE